MSVRADVGAATLAFVTRVIKGSIMTEKTVFNEETRENVKKTAEVENPVIIFFPTRSCVVMPYKEAERLGYLNQPAILNLDAVKDSSTIAGRFKFSINEDERRACWRDMENALIASCTARGGFPLPLDARIDDRSIYVDMDRKNMFEMKETLNAH